MTVYNITSIIDNENMDSYLRLLNIDKIMVTYSDWLNKFGIRVTPNKNEYIKKELLKFIIDKYDLNNKYIADLIDYPVVTMQSIKESDFYEQV